VRETTLQTPRSVKKEGGGGAAGIGAEIPLQPVMKTMVRQAVPLEFMEVHGGAEIHLQPVEDPTLEQVGAQRRLSPCGKPMMDQTPAGPETLRREEPTLDQVCWQEL